MKIRTQFTLFYALLAIFEIVSEIYRFLPGIYTAKPLLMVSLGTFAFFQFKGKIRSNQSVYLAGAFFACLGDIFLMLKGANLFLPGLGSFLIMQWFYIFLFSNDVRKPVLRLQSIIYAVPYLLFTAGLLWVLLPAISHNPVLTTAITIYAISIATMGWMSALRSQSNHTGSFLYVLVGAIFFIISDGLIAIGKFLTPIPNSALMVMSTYALAQYLIMMGLLKSADR
jgi:uncharacterized membrane protein YhhN